MCLFEMYVMTQSFQAATHAALLIFILFFLERNYKEYPHFMASSPSQGLSRNQNRISRKRWESLTCKFKCGLHRMPASLQ